MANIVFFVVLTLAFLKFGRAYVFGLKAGRFYSRYGENMEPDFREEPIGFVFIAIFYLAILCLIGYLAIKSGIDAYGYIFG